MEQTRKTACAPPSLEISLLQLDFPVLLRESTRATEPRDEAVLERTATNTISLADFLARANLHTSRKSVGNRIYSTYFGTQTHVKEPLVARDDQPTINAAVFVHLFGVGGKRSALILQAAQVLPVPTVDDARAHGGETACGGNKDVGEERTCGQDMIYKEKGVPVPSNSTHKNDTRRSSRTGHSSIGASHLGRKDDSGHSCCHRRTWGQYSVKGQHHCGG